MPKRKRQFIVFTTEGRYTVNADNFTHAAKLVATVLGADKLIRVDKRRS
jgi:hypothetical protein